MISYSFLFLRTTSFSDIFNSKFHQLFFFFFFFFFIAFLYPPLRPPDPTTPLLPQRRPSP